MSFKGLLKIPHVNEQWQKIVSVGKMARVKKAGMSIGQISEDGT